MGLSTQEAKTAAIEALKTVGLEDKQKDYAENLSAGLLQRLNLARCLMAPRPIYLLDEPTVNLDPYSSDFILKFVREHLAKKGITVLLATHNLWEAEKFCDRVIILHEGQILKVGSTEEIRKQTSEDILVMHFEEWNLNLEKKLKGLPFVSDMNKSELDTVGDRGIEIQLYGKKMNNRVFEIMDIVKEYGVPKYLDVRSQSLNDLFMKIIEDEGVNFEGEDATG